MTTDHEALGCRVYHQWLELDDPLPTVEELAGRSTEALSTLLRVAQRLAADRVCAQTQIGAAIATLRAKPWSEGSATWREPPRDITPTDLLRAWMSVDLASLRRRCFDRRAVTDELEQCAKGWADASAKPCPSGTELAQPELGLGARRRWARMLASVSRPRLDIDHLLASLGPDDFTGLTEFDSLYAEGLHSRGEALCSIWDSMINTGTLAPSPAPAPAYLDRHGGLGALDEALAIGPGAMIVGEANSGRGTLLRTWQRRFYAKRGPAALRGWVLSCLGTSRELARDEWARLMPANNQVWPGPEHDPRVVLVPADVAATLDGSDPELERTFAVMLERACASEASLRLVLVLDPRARDELQTRFPALAQLNTIAVPPVDPSEFLTLWVCQLPVIEDRTRRSVYLPELLFRIPRRAERFDFDDHRDLLETTQTSTGRWRRWYRRPPDARLRAAQRWLGSSWPSGLDARQLAELEALERALTPGRAREATRGSESGV